MCSDIAILIEGYLLPNLDKSSHHTRIRWKKLQCGYAEYIEMEIGDQNDIEKMFINSCAFGSVGDVYALLAAGARDLKAGLAAAIWHNHNHISRLLVSLGAIESFSTFPDIALRIDSAREDFISYAIRNTPQLLSMLSAVHSNEIISGLAECVDAGSIEGIEILISKVPANELDYIIVGVAMYAVRYSALYLVESACHNGVSILNLVNMSQLSTTCINIKEYLDDYAECYNHTKRQRTA